MLEMHVPGAFVMPNVSVFVLSRRQMRGILPIDLLFMGVGTTMMCLCQIIDERQMKGVRESEPVEGS